MMGPDGGKGMEDPALKGIIPRMVSTIFEQVENADENVEFLVTVSYIEIYMEKIRDLLNPTQDNLPVRENKVRTFLLVPLADHSSPSSGTRHIRRRYHRSVCRYGRRRYERHANGSGQSVGRLHQYER